MNLELLKHKFVATERLRYLVDNEWRVSKTAKYMPVMDPSTGKQIADANSVAAFHHRNRGRSGVLLQENFYLLRRERMVHQRAHIVELAQA